MGGEIMADQKYMEKTVYTPNLGGELYQVYVSLGGVEEILSGDGSPEGVLKAGVGAVYSDTTNGSVYVKESGTGDTGWAVVLTNADKSSLGDITADDITADSLTTDYVTYTPGSAPGTPAEGMVYYDSTSDTVLYYTGSAWEPIGATYDGHTELSDTAYTDLVIAPSNFKIPASSDPTEITWLTDLKAYSFATGEYIHLDGIQLPHGYVPDTDLLFHVHFVPAADITDGEVIRFTLTYTVTSPFASFPATDTVTTDFTNNAAARAEITAAGDAATILSGTTIQASANPHLITTSGTITGTGLTLSSVLAGKVEYTATGTTYTGEAIVTSMDFHYQVNRLGSENEYTG